MLRMKLLLFLFIIMSQDQNQTIIIGTIGIKNWGCKWDANDVLVLNEYSNTMEISFTTAWGPPENWAEQVAKHFNVTIAINYDIEGDHIGKLFF